MPDSLRARREVGPLLYETLQREGRLSALPPDVVARVRRDYFLTTARNATALRRATDILDAASAAGVELLPLKGAMLADVVYPTPGMRPMLDLDLAVRPEDLGRACGCLLALGFERSYPGRIRFAPRYAHDVALVDPEARVQVELHYRLFHELGGDASVERLYARAKKRQVLGKRRLTLAWGDQLFVVLVHGAAHGFGDSALWLFDSLLLADLAGGWREAEAEATRRGYGFAVRAAMRVARRVFGGCVPEPTGPFSLTERVRSALLAAVVGNEPLPAPLSQLQSLAARAVMTERPLELGRGLARKVELRLRERLEARRIVSCSTSSRGEKLARKARGEGEARRALPDEGERAELPPKSMSAASSAGE